MKVFNNRMVYSSLIKSLRFQNSRFKISGGTNKWVEAGQDLGINFSGRVYQNKNKNKNKNKIKIQRGQKLNKLHV